MSAKRPFGELSVSELERIMKLTFDEALCANEMEPWLARLFGTLTADVGFELWSREQARIEQRRACGRPASGRMVHPIESIH